MSRHCERPSCREKGEVAYVIDTVNLLVSVDAPIPRDSSRVNILCRRHADSLVVPRDWQIIDNRAKKQRLFSAPAGPRSVKTKKAKAVKNKTGAVIQDLFDFATRVVAAPAREPEPTLEVSAELVEIETEIEMIDPQETQAMPWTPQFDRTGDLDGKLRARGKLLSRAFGNFDDVDHDQDHDQQHPEY